jgi:hypothetical protein
MAMLCAGRPMFKANDEVVSFVYHPPEVEPGTRATIVSPKSGSLYAVQLPNGEFHRWLAGSELKAAEPRPYAVRLFAPGSLARVVAAQGHHESIKEGMIVRILQTLERVPYYDVMIDGKYHRWLAEFEIAPISAAGRFVAV